MLRSIALLAGFFAFAGCSASAKAIMEYALPNGASLPHRIAKGTDGNMWFTEQTGHRIGRINPAGTIAEFDLPNGGNPMGLAAGPDGKMWFTESPGHRIGRIDAAGKIVEFSAGLSANGSPGEITAGPDGALWFGEDVSLSDGTYGSKIGRITTAGTIAEFVLPDRSGVLNNIASDSERIWFTLGFPGNGIGWMDVRTHHATVVALPDGTSYAQGIALGSDGNTWFAMPQDHRMGRITKDGKITMFPMPDRGDVTGSPSNVALGPDGAMLFTEFNQSRVGRVTTAGVITEVSDGITDGSSPDGIALGSDGNLWFTEYNGNRIGKLKPSP
jgi:virginiamycin B lyase